LTRRSEASGAGTAGPADLIAGLDELTGVRVLVVGDVMLDRFVSGSVERISPEAPIPVFRIENETEMLGGAGNVTRNIATLETAVSLVAARGGDEAGDRVARLLDIQEHVSAHLVVAGDRGTGIKTRFISGTQQMLRTDDETVLPLDAETRARLFEVVAREIGSADVVVLSDYGKGVLADGMAGEIISLASKARKPVIVDPSGTDFSRYRGAAVVTPNRKELSDAVGCAVVNRAETAGAAHAVIRDCGISAVVATLGADGMLVVEGSGDGHYLAAEARDVYDVSGAGDTVVAALAAALGAGWPLVRAAELANVAAGVVVGKVGTAVAYPSDIVAALHQKDAMAGETKVLPLEAAVDRAARWRRQNLRVGFTNGCFDLLHPGHVSLLNQAKRGCDRLIVGLNSDDSTRRLKGPERPIQSEAARAAVLASLADVDLVVIFAEDTPAKLIDEIRPELFVKGADYRVEDIPEATIVKRYGGEVMLAEFVDGQSTTSTIARIAK
jgi:D-beta-D-heptose 7-phosphate kinase/D-beta-D-heptose 1-phosphate adenosyltransferase